VALYQEYEIAPKSVGSDLKKFLVAVHRAPAGIALAPANSLAL
jgi:hypothetical protein